MSRCLFAALLAVSLGLLPVSVSARVAPEPLDLIGLADRYCIDPDGDHELTWAKAVRDGFVELSPEDFPNLRLPGARQLKGFTRTEDGVEVRVLTAVNRWVGGGQGETPFHLCWVSAAPYERRAVDREIGGWLGVDRFRQGDALVYAWIPLESGGRRSVSRREFQRHGMAIAREEGMRMVLTNQHGAMVAVTYMTPVESCADWCY